MDVKTDLSCHNNSKQKRQDWLRLIDSMRKLGVQGLMFPPLPLTCHYLTATFFLAIRSVRLTPFQKPSLPLVTAEDGVKGQPVGVQAKMALVLVCRRLWVATGVLAVCHVPLAVMSRRPTLQNFGQLGAVTKPHHISSSSWLFKTLWGGKILIELHRYIISKDIGK